MRLDKPRNTSSNQPQVLPRQVNKLIKYEAKSIDLNLIDNGSLTLLGTNNGNVAEGFETFYSTTGAEPLFTTQEGLDAGTTYEVRPISGQYMFKIDSAGSTIASAGMRTQFRTAITAASTYNYRVWAKAYATTGYVFGKVEWFGTTGNAISNDTTNSLYGYADWTQLILSTTSPTGAEYARFSVESASEVNGKFWIDQLYVKLDTKNYITSTEFTSLTQSEVGTGKEISTDDFNQAVKTASRIAERDTGRRWYPKDESYTLIQSAIAFLTASIVKSGYYGDIPEPELKVEGATTDWNKAQYEYYIKKALRAEGKIYVNSMTDTGNPYW